MIGNKKGDIQMLIYLVGALFLLLLLGMGIAFGSMTIDWIFDETIPEVSYLGEIGDSNMTEYAEYSFAPVNTFVQSFTYLGGILYVFGLLGILGFAFAFRFTGNKWLMGFFIVSMLLLVVASIFLSNIYEEFYDEDSEVGDRLQEQTLLSWMILYSPLIMCVIGFIGGIIMFTGEGGENVI